MIEEKDYIEIMQKFEPIIENLIFKHKKNIGMDKEDIRQELCIKVFMVLQDKHKKLGTEVYPYITTCLKNLIMDLIRSTSRYNYELLYDDLLYIKNNDLHIRKSVQELLEGLTKEEKTIALLYIDGLYQKEIGKIIGISQQRISNKLKGIRSKIERNI